MSELGNNVDSGLLLYLRWVVYTNIQWNTDCRNNQHAGCGDAPHGVKMLSVEQTLFQFHLFPKETRMSESLQGLGSWPYIQGVMVWFLAGARGYCLLQTVQTSYEVHPASQPMGMSGSFPEGYSGQVLKPSSARIKNGRCDTSAPSHTVVLCTAATLNCTILSKLPATGTCATFSFKSIDYPTDEQWYQDNSNSVVTRLQAVWLKKLGLISGGAAQNRPYDPLIFLFSGYCSLFPQR